jgi:protein-S-isoprenylcysteine O-methyltransferase Ste14
MDTKFSKVAQLLAWVQAVYYLITGIWPLLSIKTFEKLTGPKTDKWLVKTVGVVVTVIGSVLMLAQSRQNPGKIVPNSRKYRSWQPQAH